MTEKRFVEYYAGKTIKKLIGIEDIETNRVCVTIEENIQLLNELDNENEQLKVKNQKQENLINAQNKVIEELENWFDKWGFDTVNYRILDEIMEHFLEGDINEIG